MLTGLQLGIGSIGTLLATAPLAYATTLIGWRGSFLAVAIITCLILVWIAFEVTDKSPRIAAAVAPSAVAPSAVAPSAIAPDSRIFVTECIVKRSFPDFIVLPGGGSCAPSL